MLFLNFNTYLNYLAPHYHISAIFLTCVSSAGIIKDAFRLGDLAAYTGEVKINKSKVVSVRQAALEIYPANRFTVNGCKCKGK